MTATTQAESNRALVRKLYDEFLDAMDGDLLEEIYASDVVVHNLPDGEGGLTGHQALREYFQALSDAFPDLKTEIKAIVAEDDLIAVRNRYTGTQEGEFMGAPGTGETVAFDGMVFFRIDDGKIAETWGQVDTLGMLQQLGVTEVPGT